jgi:hypothetical protein
MIRIAITQAAFDAICATLPLGSVAYEAETNAKGERLIWLELKWADQLGALALTQSEACVIGTVTVIRGVTREQSDSYPAGLFSEAPGSPIGKRSVCGPALWPVLD